MFTEHKFAFTMDVKVEVKEEGSERTLESLDQKAIEDGKLEVSQELVPQGPAQAYTPLVPTNPRC